MDTQNNDNRSLTAIIADRPWVEALAARQLISPAARLHALDLLSPPRQWALWAARLLTALGTALVLAGVIYFFAFNWAVIPPLAKLAVIGPSMLLCVGGTLVLGFEHLAGRMLLLAGSVLVGVFLAVYGQIYQTGADAYQLFQAWALLILPWVLLSNFAALWGVWLVVGNLFLALYWQQALSGYSRWWFGHTELFTILALGNGLMLLLREWAYARGQHWLAGRWTRVVLLIAILLALLFPTSAFIFEPNRATPWILLGTVISLALHGALFRLYRTRLPDMWALATLTLSATLVADLAIYKLLGESFGFEKAPTLLLHGLLTLGLFAGAIVFLRKLSHAMETKHG